MTHHDQLIEMGSYYDKASLERKVRYLGYEIRHLRRKVSVMADIKAVQELGLEIYRLETFRKEFEILKNSL